MIDDPLDRGAALHGSDCDLVTQQVSVLQVPYLVASNSSSFRSVVSRKHGWSFLYRPPRPRLLAGRVFLFPVQTLLGLDTNRHLQNHEIMVKVHGYWEVSPTTVTTAEL